MEPLNKAKLVQETRECYHPTDPVHFLCLNMRCRERMYFLRDLINQNANITWRQEVVNSVQCASSIIHGSEYRQITTASRLCLKSNGSSNTSRKSVATTLYCFCYIYRLFRLFTAWQFCSLIILKPTMCSVCIKSCLVADKENERRLAHAVSHDCSGMISTNDVWFTPFF